MSQTTGPSEWLWITDGTSPIYDKGGFTGIATRNSWEGALGQVPVTALTRRIGYCRGGGPARGLYGQGSDWEDRSGNERKVWFCKRNNDVVVIPVAGAYVGGSHSEERSQLRKTYDYILVFFAQELPQGIDPVPWVLAPPDNWDQSYHFCFKKTQHGLVDIGVPGFLVDTWKTEGGNSGGPLLLFSHSSGHDLIFIGGITTAMMDSAGAAHIQQDMESLYTHFNPIYTLNHDRDFQLHSVPSP